MKRVEGVIVSFLNDPTRGPRHGIAKIVGEDAFTKEVFLPGASMRKELNGYCVHFQIGEDRPAAQPSMRIVMDITPDGSRGFVANNWALKT